MARSSTGGTAAELAIDSFLARIEELGRSPDAWESSHVLEALLAFERGDYLLALSLIDRATAPLRARAAPAPDPQAPDSFAQVAIPGRIGWLH